MTEGERYVTVQEATRLLETTEGAIRKRIQRGSLESKRGPDGRVYVRVDSGETGHDTGQDAGGRADSSPGGAEAELRARVESLERQLEEANTRDRENRRLLAAALERLPELEIGEGPRERDEEGPRSHTEPPGGVDHQGPESGTQRPWWRRLFKR